MSLKPVWATPWDLIWKENKTKKQLLPSDKISNPAPSCQEPEFYSPVWQDSQTTQTQRTHQEVEWESSKVLIGITCLEDLPHTMESAMGNFTHGSEPGKQLWLEFIRQSQQMRTPHAKESLELNFFSFQEGWSVSLHTEPCSLGLPCPDSLPSKNQRIPAAWSSVSPK